MDEHSSKVARIRSFIVKKFPASRRKHLDDTVPLLESGIIDSLGVLDVVTFLEREFTIKVSDDELTPENFANVQSLAFFVKSKTDQLGTSAT